MDKKLAVIVLTVLSLTAPGAAQKAGDAADSDNNIAFDLPDLTVTIEGTTGQFQLEAYKSINNDAIIQGGQSTKTSQLIWVSIGQPLFATTASRFNASDFRLFHFTTSGFHTHILMLTNEHRERLVQVANKKYGITISPDQIVNLVLAKFECSLILYDDDDNRHLLKGRVLDFRTFPLRMDFDAPRTSISRKVLLQQLTSSTDPDLQFTCSLASKGKVMRTNTLSINTQQMQQIGLQDKLFGPSGKSSDSVYVSRDQLTALSNEMYSELNIIEEYQMPDAEFSNAFVDGLIREVATSQFTMTPVDKVLESLSTYGFDFGSDLKPDEIKRDMGSILEIKKNGDKSHIVLNNEQYQQAKQTSSTSGGASVGGFGFKASANWAKENSKSSESNTKSLNDQLRELNTESQNDIEWTIEGNRVVPKSLNVAKFTQSSFSKTLTFKRVRIQSYNAAFEREFGVYTHRAKASASFLNELRLNMEILFNRTAATTGLAISASSKADRASSKADSASSKADNAHNVANQAQATANSAYNLANSASSKADSASSKAHSAHNAANQAQATANNKLRACRVCFYQSNGSSNGQCQGSFNFCSDWSSASNPYPGWSAAYIDDTDNRGTWCTYHWKVDCLT